MALLPHINPTLLWSGFIALIAVFLAVDIVIFHKKHHAISIKEALVWTGVWVALSLLFNVFVWLEFGSEPAVQFFTGYLIEKSLSVDNLFVILLIFTAFKIEHKFQHEVLFWGIVGALVMRGALIVLGSALVTRFVWVMLLFGAFIIYAGIKMAFKRDEEFDPHESWIVRTVRKVVHVTRDHADGRFIKKEKGRTVITILLVALIVIEFTDLIFAFDSIPAIFAITTDPFIVFTSNIFAILGLRSLYFVIAKTHDLFFYLNYGLATILVFIGAKMLYETAGELLHREWPHLNIFVSLGVVILVLVVSILASIAHQQRQRRTSHAKKKRVKG
jgi:tellurite resistance protein TerC